MVNLAIVGCLLGNDLYKKKNYKPFLVVFIVFLVGAVMWRMRDSDEWQSLAKVYATLFY
ncbi:MAG TPA: hypothetical protein PK977_05975 [Chitinophagaceae bacterium]|nr:hypothetical protein [Chitinophagaceae bacterium]